MTEKIKLKFTQFGKLATVEWATDTEQKGGGSFTLPWQDNVEWSAIYQSLKLFSEDSKRPVPSGEVRQKAIEKGLCDEQGIPRPERLQIIGQELYQAIFANEENEELERAFREAIRLSARPTVVFHFSKAGSYLQTYPWEIMHDGEDFLFKSRASIVRHVDFQGHITPIELKNKLPLLLVDPRPALPTQYDNGLPLLDRQVLREQLGQNALLNPVMLDDEHGKLTFERFLTDLSNYHNQTKIIHIDTHGDYGRLCEACNHLVTGTVCPNPKCGMPVDTSKPAQGHLAFEHDKGFEWISAERLGEVFAHRNITLVVITACSSALTGQGTAFNSVAGALIKYGIPAVVAMQFPVEDQSTQQFVQHFYQILVRDRHLSSAVQIARASIQRVDDAWYRPAVYLRTNPKNMLGQLFYTSWDWVEEHAGQFKKDLVSLENDSEAKIGKIHYILGKQPILEDIADGRYMDRHALVEDVLTEIDNINVSNRGLSIFWIHGRSGSGKSVLLLQVIRQLVQQQKGEVIWLNSASRKLIDLLEIWKMNPPPSDIRWFIAVDDLYAPGRLEQYHLEQISSIIISNPGIQFPTLLTCSPTNQLENFENDIDESSIVRWEMPLIDKDESRELQQWYTNTTGKNPQTIGEAFEQNEGLILSMMIEIHEGEIKEYAKRFTNRLKSALLAEALTPILTLNRLYIYPPKNWLNDDQYDALRRFNSQDDFAIEAGDIPENQDGIRLRHPHLSNEFYLQLRRDYDVIVRTRDLEHAFERILRDAPYLIKDLLRGFVQLPDRLKAIDTVTLAQKVGDIWNEQYANILLPLSDRSFIWLALLQWGGTEPQILSRLREHPADVLLIMLEQHDDLRIWSIIWQNSFDELLDEDRRAKYIALGIRWLPDHMQQSGWSFIWERLFDIAFAPDASELRVSLIEIGILWLRKNAELQDWNYVWQRLVDYAFEVDDLELSSILLAIGSDWVEQHPDNRGWPFVFQKMLDYAPLHEDFEDTSDLTACGIDWLINQPLTIEWTFVYIKILRREVEMPDVLRLRLKERYIHLLSQDQGRHQQWTFLFSLLNYHAENVLSVRLVDVGITWLNTNIGTEMWTYVFENLIVKHMQLTEDQQSRLLEIGISWLSESKHDVGWWLVVKRIGEHIIKSDEMLQRHFAVAGLEQIHKNPQYELAHETYRAVIRVKHVLTDEEKQFIANAGIHWLYSNEINFKWTQIYESIAELMQYVSEESQRRFIEFGIIFLQNNLNVFERWRETFRGIVQVEHLLTDSEKKLLIDCAKQEMQFYSMDEEDYANRIYRLLLQYGSFFNKDVQVWLIAIGKQWLIKNPYMLSWDYLYSDLFRYAELMSNDDIDWFIETGLKWLDKHLDARTWPYVFRMIAYHRQYSNEPIGAELLRLGGKWRLEGDLKISPSDAKSYKKLLTIVNKIMTELGDELFEEGLPFRIGDRLQGVVTNIKDYGVFVNVNGISGLIHISEIVHHHVNHPSDVLNVGDSVKVDVININKKKKHITLSRKAAIPDPWTVFLSKYKVGDVVTGSVSNLVDYGVFIVLDVGVVGLIHNTKISTLGDDTPQEHFKKGDKLNLTILSIDEEQHRVAFSLDKLHNAEHYED